MKYLLAFSLLSAAVSTSKAALPCRLTPDDHRALAVSDSKLTPDKIASLTAAAQKELCATRSFVRKVMTIGTRLEVVEDYSTDYVSDEEFDRIRQVESAVIARKLKAKGYGIKD